MIGTTARRLIRWTPPLAYMGFIFYLSSESNPMPALTAVVWDKLLHTTGYAALGGLLAFALSGERLRWSSAWMIATAVASLYGASDEFHQSFVAGRDSDVHDWMADTLGGLAGAGAALALVAIIRAWMARRQQSTVTGRR